MDARHFPSLITVSAAFAFGEDIGALAAWTVGNVLDTVKENDEKSKIMPLVGNNFFLVVTTAYCCQLSNIPAMASAWSRLESHIYRLTGWQSRSTAAMKAFDNVSNVRSLTMHLLSKQWSSVQLQRLNSASKSSAAPHPNFISTMIRSRLSPESALSEAKEMLGPGTDTTSATLAHILWGLAHDISFQDELASDLAETGWPTDMSVLEAVPRLRAATKEGIRWAGAAAAMLPRVVPEGGVTFAGKFIPAGVSSSAQISEAVLVLKLISLDNYEQLSYMVPA